MLAATARLASAALRATSSPGRTSRHVSTAFRAPGINSGCEEPNFISIILLELARYSSSGQWRLFSFQLPVRPVQGVGRGARVANRVFRRRSLPPPSPPPFPARPHPPPLVPPPCFHLPSPSPRDC